MSTADVLQIPKPMGSIELTSSGPGFPPLNKIKIVVEGEVFEIVDSLATSSVLGKLQRVEDGSYRLPDDWNVHATQFSALFGLLHSTK